MPELCELEDFATAWRDPKQEQPPDLHEQKVIGLVRHVRITIAAPEGPKTYDEREPTMQECPVHFANVGGNDPVWYRDDYPGIPLGDRLLAWRYDGEPFGPRQIYP